MAEIVTLTVNPSIDVATSVERVAPFHKLRCGAERRDPGGGGINVARVMKRLGAMWSPCIRPAVRSANCCGVLWIKKACQD